MASSTDKSGMKFEVFLSFRGSDTRQDFTSCLYEDMLEKGIRVFKDDKELKFGGKIGEELFKALDESQIYIPIFSKNFASSAWCLREIVRMVDCTKNSHGKKDILPIFLDVKPEDVKSSTGLYSNSLSKLGKEKVKYGHEEEKEKYHPDEVKRWGDAVREVATRVGWNLEGKGSGQLIKAIIRELLLKLTGKNRALPDHLVETDNLENTEILLDFDSDDDVRFLIIHGVGGIGKSALASVIFNKFRSKFNCSSFLDDVPRQCLLEVQKKLLRDTLGSTSADGVLDTNDGTDRIRRGLKAKKVLVVIDNMDEKKQLKNLAGRCDWFGCGSRIIITVRDKSSILDKDNQTLPSNYLAYPMMEMHKDQAIQLFSNHAFRSDTPPEVLYNFSEEVISSIGRLPLTLKVVGSFFANTERSDWGKTLGDFKQAPHRDVRETLMISINKLGKTEKAIFLDIACFCIGKDKTYAEYMWRSSGYSLCIAIDVLLLMSLIKIDKLNRFWMHDELRDLGRYIVKEENIEEAGERRWVRIDENTLNILSSDEKKRNVRALSLGISHVLKAEELAHFPRLMFLGGQRLNFVGDFKNCLCSLKWLSWVCYSWDFAATNLHLVTLVVLDLSFSKITHDWGGWRQIEMAQKLKVLDLSECHELTKTPDFSEFGELEKLILDGCLNLSTIDSSIGKLTMLSTLSIKACKSLKELPEEIGSLGRLSEICMPRCMSEICVPKEVFKFFQPDVPHLIKLPETLGNLKSLTKFKAESINLPNSIGNLNLTQLDLSFSQILELPYSIGEIESLVELDLCWTDISVLPDSIKRLKNLKRLLLSDCRNLDRLPDSIGELESLGELHIDSSSISVLPESIGRLKNLKHLLLCKCKNICRLSDSIGELESLVELDLSFSGISLLPDSIRMLKNLKYLLLCGCKNLFELLDPIGELEALVKLDLKLSGISILPDSIGRLKNLKYLFLSKCKNLYKLPDSIKELKSLVELDIKFSPISIIRHSTGTLTNFTHMSFSKCGNLFELLRFGEPKSLVKLDLKRLELSIVLESIGGFASFTYLSFFECKNLHKLPNFFGQMELLVELDLTSLGISFLPNSIGNLKKLNVLKMAYTNIHTIPRALGQVKTLEGFDASFCQHLMDEIPWEMWSLTRLRILELYGSPISTVPRKINSFSNLQILTIVKIVSHWFSPLPELPSCLKYLMVEAAQFPYLLTS